jgi:Rps23 Pro-64 3,4-dihydroxylase Tpa1-like proline 4-hydroxylase
MIDYAKLDAAADRWRERFHEASPFPHLVIDGLFDANLAAEIGAAFPPVRAGFRSHRHLHSDKYSVQDEAQFPPVVRMAMDELHGPRFLAWLERATGMAGLEPDPHRFGEGMHASGPGGFLDVHADFNEHPITRKQRILNLLIYVNPGWEPAWRGDLELWSADMKRCVQRIAPVLNRAVLFECSDVSFHGLPEPLACPPERQRNALQLYYYRDWLDGRTPPRLHTTDYRPRPTDYAKRLRHAVTRAIGPRGRALLRRVVGRS